MWRRGGRKGEVKECKRMREGEKRMGEKGGEGWRESRRKGDRGSRTVGEKGGERVVEREREYSRREGERVAARISC